jgi:hypothetical protein
MRLQRRFVVACLVAVVFACTPSVRAEDPQPMRPAAKALAEAILGGDAQQRGRAAGWLASMGEAEIAEVLEWVHRLQVPASPGPGRVDLRVRAAIGGQPAQAVRIGFHRAILGSERSPALELLRSALEPAQVALERRPYRLQVEREGATRLDTSLLDPSVLQQPLSLQLGTGGLRAQVLDRFGRPCEGFTVEAWSQSPSVRWLVAHQPLDADGFAALRGLPPREWTVRAAGPGGHVAVTRTVVVRDEAVVEMRFDVPPHGRLLLTAAEDVRGVSPQLRFLLMRPGVMTEIGLRAGEQQQLALPLGEWMLSTNGRQERIEIREGATLRRSGPP